MLCPPRLGIKVNSTGCPTAVNVVCNVPVVDATLVYDTTVFNATLVRASVADAIATNVVLRMPLLWRSLF